MIKHLYGGKYGLVKLRVPLERGVISRFSPQTNRDSQVSGEDEILTLKDSQGNFIKDVSIDEKTTLYHPKIIGNNLYTGLPTFAFELASNIDYTGEGYKKGWMLNDELVTDYYLINWPTLTVKNQSKEIPSPHFYWWHSDLMNQYGVDIDSIESVLIAKKALVKFVVSLLQNNSEVNSIYDKPQSLQNFLIDKNEKYYIKDKIRLVYSRNLREKPINIVIPKKYLYKLSQIHTISYRQKRPDIKYKPENIKY